MWNIFFSYFDSVFSLESFLIEINFKLLTDKSPKEDDLRCVLKHLATIKITFDFQFKGNIYTLYSLKSSAITKKLFIFKNKHIKTDHIQKGPYRSYIDTRYTYEQLLLLCYLKINESRDKFENHMFAISNFNVQVF